MSQQPAPRTNKIPFLVTDLVCIAVATFIIYRNPSVLDGMQALAVVACVVAGAWFCTTPFLRDHDADVRMAESGNLNETVSQITQLKLLASQIQGATAQWQTFQENAEQATSAMRTMAGQLTTDAQNFAEAMKQSNDSEKGALRLEVEKRKRAEGDWLKIMVALLDHVHALYLAGIRSGQQNVIQQLGGFQAACRDLVRRVGLVAVEAQPGESFKPGTHQISDEKQVVPPGSVVAGTLATGISFQGQLIRPVLVSLEVQRQASPTPAEEVEMMMDESPESGTSELTSDDMAEDEMGSDFEGPESHPPIV